MNGTILHSKLVHASMAACLAALILVALSSCALMGRTDTQTIVLVEPGDVAEVVSDGKVTVRSVYTAADGTKKEAIADRSIAGTVAMPKSVYRKMRASYSALYDFLNGKITEQQLQDQVKQAKAGQGAEDDQKGGK